MNDQQKKAYSDYTFRTASPEDAPNIWRIMDHCSQHLAQKDLFVCDDLEYVKDIITTSGFAVVACDADNNIVADLLVKYPGIHEENLGYDIFPHYTSVMSTLHFSDISDFTADFKNFSACPLNEADTSNPSQPLSLPQFHEKLNQVVHLDSACVLPSHRGQGLECRMISFAQTLIDRNKYRYAFATAAPENIASLKSLEKNGFHVMTTKEKYGGMMRCILMKLLYQ